jgi:hypothetical protein
VVRDAAEGEGLEKEGEVREAVGVGGAVVVFIRAVARRRGERFAFWGVGRRPLPLARRRGPGANGFAHLGGWHVDPSCQMARACKMNATVSCSHAAIVMIERNLSFPPFYL